MRIPVGDFGLSQTNLTRGGDVTPNVHPGAFVTPGLGEIGDAGIALGKSMAADAADAAQVAAMERRQAQLQAKADQRVLDAENKAMAREEKLAEARTLHAQGWGALGAAYDSIAQGVQQGTVNKDEAPNLWQEQGRKVIDEFAGRANAAFTGTVRAGLEQDFQRHALNLNQVIVKQTASNIKGQLGQTIEALQRSVNDDLPKAIALAQSALDTDGPKAGMQAADIAKAKQSIAEEFTYRKFHADLVTARGNYDALQGLIDTVSKNTVIDSFKKDNIINGARANQLALERRAEAAANKAESRAARAVQELDRMDAAGMQIPSAKWDEAAALTRGTQYEPLIAEMITQNGETQQLLQKPIPQQHAEVKDLVARAAASGDLKAMANAERKARAVYANTKLLTEETYAWAVKRTGADPTPLDLNNIKDWGDILRNRFDVVDAIAREHGTKRRLLYEAEAKALSQSLQGGDVKSAMGMLATLRQKIPDDNAFRDTMQQIAPDAPIIAKAGVHLGRGSRFEDKTAELIVRGNAILHPNRKEDGKPHGGLLPMPQESLTRAMYYQYVGDSATFSPQTSQNNYQATMAVYAALAAEKGGDSSVLDPSLMKEAMRRAVGDVRRYRGRDVVMPPGVEFDAFKDGVTARIDEMAKAGRFVITADQVKALPLQNMDDGKFMIRAGDGFLRDKEGRNVVIDFDVKVTAIPSAKPRRGSLKMNFEFPSP